MDSFKSFILCHRAEMTMHQIGHELNIADLRYDHAAEMKAAKNLHTVRVIMPHRCYMAARAERLLLSDLR